MVEAESETPIKDIFADNPQTWLGITIGIGEATGEEITPRQPIGSVPYAVRAKNADTADHANTAGSATVSVGVTGGLQCQTFDKTKFLEAHEHVDSGTCPSGWSLTGGSCSIVGDNNGALIEDSYFKWGNTQFACRPNMDCEVKIYIRCCKVNQ